MLAIVGSAICAAAVSVPTKRYGGALHPAALNAPAMLIGAVALLAGPEGGFAPEEERAARQAGFRPLRLGPRVLRTETAAVAALAAMQALWGDF